MRFPGSNWGVSASAGPRTSGSIFRQDSLDRLQPFDFRPFVAESWFAEQCGSSGKSGNRSIPLVHDDNGPQVSLREAQFFGEFSNAPYGGVQNQEIDYETELAYDVRSIGSAVGGKSTIPSAIKSLANPEDKSQVTISYENGLRGHEPPQESLPVNILGIF